MALLQQKYKGVHLMLIGKGPNFIIDAAALSAIIFGIVCGVWFLVTGEIPAIQELIMSASKNKQEEIVWTLPFGISDLWNVTVAPLFFLAFYWFGLKAGEERDFLVDNKKALLTGAAFGLLFSMMIGILIGKFFGLAPAIFFGLTFELVAMLLIKKLWRDRIVESFFFVAGYGLAFGFVLGLAWNMPLGAVFGLAVALPPFVVLLVIWSLKKILRIIFRSKLGVGNVC